MHEPRRESVGQYSQLHQRLLEGFGLQFAPASKEIASAARSRSKSLGLTWAKYQDLLDGPAGTEELFKLAGELSLGQMDFNDEHLLAVSQQFLRPLLRSRQANKPEGSKPNLSIWSAGCGCGAEIYSLLLQLAKCTSLPAWDLRILATDLNRALLEQARLGIYSAEQLGRVDQDDLQNHFTAEPRSVGGLGRWAIRDEFRSSVDFRLHNILSPEMPGDFSGQFDLVVCRAILAQLGRQAKTQVLSKLARALSPNGLLVVAASEAAGLDHPLLQAVSEEFNCVLRRRPVRAKHGPSEALQVQPGSERAGLRSKLRGIYLPTSAKSAFGRRKPPRSVVSGRAVGAEYLRRGKHLAEDFQFPQALLACRRARRLDEFNVEAHYVTGVVARRMDRLDEAIEAFERACGLDKTLVMAHFLLGRIYQETDKPALARGHYGEALAGLADRSADEPLRFADGMSVQVLTDLCTVGKDALSEVGIGET